MKVEKKEEEEEEEEEKEKEEKMPISMKNQQSVEMSHFPWTKTARIPQFLQTRKSDHLCHNSVHMTHVRSAINRVAFTCTHSHQ